LLGRSWAYCSVAHYNEAPEEQQKYRNQGVNRAIIETMQSIANQQNSLCKQALQAETAADRPHAADLYREAIALDKSNPTPYLFLGFVLLGSGQEDAAAQVWSLAADLDSRLINAWRNDAVPDDIRLRSRAADETVRRHFSELHDDSMRVYREQYPAANIGRIEAAVWCQTHPSSFDYRTPEQRPHIFFVPELPAIPVFSDEHIPWRHDLQQAVDDIRREFIAAQAEKEAAPYVEMPASALGDDWTPLAQSMNWSAFHVYKKGLAVDDMLAIFPATMAALDNVPLLQIDGNPSEVLFSVLQGNKRIPPHYGLANTDVTVHLPIVTTTGSGIRVVDKSYDWEYGKVFAFDDAFIHESWNDNAEARVNLLFEAWHPDLSEHERGAVSATFAARKQWTSLRTIAPASARSNSVAR